MNRKIEKSNLPSLGEGDYVTDGEPRVLYFTSAPQVQGGAAQSMFRVARWLKAQGGVPVVVLPGAGGIVEWYTREGIDVHIIPFVEMHRRRSPVHLARYLLSTIGIVAKLLSLIRQQRVDMVHVNEITYFPGLIAGRMAGVKTLCHVRLILERPAWIRRTLSWTAQRLSHEVICVSEAVQRAMFPHQASNVRTLHNPGPELHRFDPRLARNAATIRRQFGLAADTFLVGQVSKFTPNKGHLALVEAARMISEDSAGLKRAYLVVGGKLPRHKEYFASVCDKIEQYGLKDSFILTGARDDVPELVSACDVMVHLPQHEDPFPGVVLEAMAMEKPIVAFASGGIPEQFENGRSGILLDKNDIEGLAKSLLALEADEALRLQIGREARRFLTSHLSFEKFFLELSRIYAELLAPIPRLGV